MVDHSIKALELLAIVVVAGEIHLVLGQLVTSIVGNQAFTIDEPEAFTRFVFAQALAHKELHNLFRHSDASTTSTQEHSPVVFG